MTTRATYALTALCLLFGLASDLSAQKTPTIDVTGPTIVAFFVPMSGAELSGSPDTAEALSDFQLYLTKIREPLAKRGIALSEVHADQFVIRQGTTTTMYGVRRYKVGYCFALPKKEPRVQFGVLTDKDLLHLADEYFGPKPK
jgi:hypothetical protein